MLIIVIIYIYSFLASFKNHYLVLLKKLSEELNTIEM